jgi:N-methylhydantoinase B
MREALKKIPSGNVTITTKHDPFPGLPKDGLKIKVNVNIDNVSGFIKVDLRDNPDNIPCGLNLTEATSRSGVMTGIFNSIDHTVPPNSGSFRCVEIQLRKGCIVGIPEHPYSCSLATSNICDRLENAVVQAFAQMGEGFGMAECGSLLPPATGVISGHDPRNDRYFVNEIFLFHTAAGASPDADGWLTLTGMGSAGLCLLDSVELDELRFPMKVYKQEIYINSEGAGRRRGSPGAYVEFGPFGSNMKVAYASDGSHFPAAGVRGGGNASKAQQYKIDKFGKKINLPIVNEVELLENERIVSITQPGGGYGPPHERELPRVQKDFLEGWITKKRAYEVYGVKFNTKGEINENETSIKRKLLKKKYN